MARIHYEKDDQPRYGACGMRPVLTSRDPAAVDCKLCTALLEAVRGEPPPPLDPYEVRWSTGARKKDLMHAVEQVLIMLHAKSKGIPEDGEVVLTEDEQSVIGAVFEGIVEFLVEMHILEQPDVICCPKWKQYRWALRQAPGPVVRCPWCGTSRTSLPDE